MTAETRRQLPMLAGLVVVLAAVAWWQFGGAAPPTGRPATAARRPQVPARADAARVETPEAVLARGVGLDRLEHDRPAPEEGSRDPFRSGPGAGSGGAVSSPTPRPVVPAPVPPGLPSGPIIPAGPPPPPPITVKFIGVVSRRDVGKVAVLSDGKNVYYGRQGEIVDGRWRIVAIGEESLQIEYVDGRGRQTVRLTG
jgi:hypothetical protein